MSVPDCSVTGAAAADDQLSGDGAGVPGAEVGAGELGDGDGDGLVGPGVGDGDGAAALVTVQMKLAEAVPPDGVVAVTVTPCLPVAEADMVPVIRPRLLIDRPRGSPVAVKAGGCPAAAASEMTCSRIAVPVVARCAPGSRRRTTVEPK